MVIIDATTGTIISVEAPYIYDGDIADNMSDSEIWTVAHRSGTPLTPQNLRDIVRDYTDNKENNHG